MSLSTGQAKAIVAFYKHYCVMSLVVTALCCRLYFIDGILLQLLAIKAITGLGIRYFINVLQRDKLFYYYNQHISKPVLWFAYFTIDIVILLLSLCAVSMIR